MSDFDVNKKLSCGITIHGNQITPRSVDVKDEDAEDVEAILERLEDMRLNIPRIALINVKCCCESSVKKVRTNTSDLVISDEEGSSVDDSDDDDDLKITQLLKTCESYAKKSAGSRSRKALRKLATTYRGQDEVDEATVLKCLSLTSDDNDIGLIECGLIIIAQLCTKEENCFKFLYQDIIATAVKILEKEIDIQVKEAAASIIHKVAVHKSLGEMWMEFMLTEGLSILLSKVGTENPLPLRYSVGEALSSLASHRNVALLLIDHALPVISLLGAVNSDCREVYTCILTQLVLHTDHTRASVLDAAALPASLHMLRQGPCGSQRQALVFIAALTQSDCGLQAILNGNAVGHCLSGFIDSKCRKVRESASAAMAGLFASRRSGFHKQVLVQVDLFFHEKEENFGFLHSGHESKTEQFKTDSNSRIHRALVELSNSLMDRIRIEARMEQNRFREIVQVHLSPGIDTDPTCLTTLNHIVLVMRNMCQLKISGIKVKGVQSKEMNPIELKEILVNTLGNINPVVVKDLLDNGATCVFDLLYAYTTKMATKLRLPVNIPPGTNVDENYIQAVVGAWTEECSDFVKKTKEKCVLKHCSTMFTDLEIQLIKNLIDLTFIFAQCSCELKEETIENEVLNKLEKVPSNEKNVKSKRIISAKHESTKDKTELLNAEIMDHPPLSELGKQYQKSLKKELAVVRRTIRVQLYEAGLVESVGSWLAVEDKAIRSKAVRCLQCIVQPVKERVMPKPAAPAVMETRKRPFSAMTPKERDHEINLALNQMSSKVKDFIKEALANEYQEPSNPQNSPEHGTKREVKATNCAVALKVRPPSGKRPNSGIRRNSGSNSAVAVKVSQCSPLSRPTSGRSNMSSVQNSSRLSPGNATNGDNGNNSPPRPDSAKSSISNGFSKNKSLSTLKQLERHYGPLPWKPQVDFTKSVTTQCQMRVVEICGKHVISNMMVKEKNVKKSSLIFLHELVSNSQSEVHMKLSEDGIVPKLVDFLRINDDHELLEIIGLTVCRCLINSDHRLRQLFNRHGGSQLLMAMTSYTSGILRKEVSMTLSALTQYSQIATKSKKQSRRAHSAPVGSVKKVPDVWDRISQRWREEDEITRLLKRSGPAL